MISNEGEATSLIIRKSTTQLQHIYIYINKAAGSVQKEYHVGCRCGNSTEAMAFRELSIRLYFEPMKKEKD